MKYVTSRRGSGGGSSAGGSSSRGLTHNDLMTLDGGAPRPRDDDDMSEAFSDISMNPTGHAERRIQERSITEDDIRRAKQQGKLSLSIHLNGEEDTGGAKDEINWWAGWLKEAFQDLEVGDVIEKGTQDRRVQVELRGSENKGPGSRALACRFF